MVTNIDETLTCFFFFFFFFLFLFLGPLKYHDGYVFYTSHGAWVSHFIELLLASLYTCMVHGGVDFLSFFTV